MLSPTGKGVTYNIKKKTGVLLVAQKCLMKTNLWKIGRIRKAIHKLPNGPEHTHAGQVCCWYDSGSLS